MASIPPGSHDPLFYVSSPEPSPHPPQNYGSTTTTISITRPGSIDSPFLVNSSPETSPRPARQRGTTTTTISITGPGSTVNDPLFVDSSSPERLGSSVFRAVPSTRTARRNAGPMGPRPLGSPLLIYGGPPSGMLQQTRPPSHRPLAPVAMRSLEWGAEMVRRCTLIGMSSSRSDRPTGIRIRRPGRRRRQIGWRTARVFPLTHDDLYLTAARPQTMYTDRSHHSCGVCLQVKSHPVSYACGTATATSASACGSKILGSARTAAQ
ncbi:hypothetical protein B0H13DRAFT_2355763 [Mycena leptocephala]|nr:hypothetical protein B0H13DRAFT_2355763 [Mycena leptocephala]